MRNADGLRSASANVQKPKPGVEQRKLVSGWYVSKMHAENDCGKRRRARRKTAGVPDNW